MSIYDLKCETAFDGYRVTGVVREQETLIIPEGVVEIGVGALAGCDMVTLQLPRSLWRMSRHALAGCSRLQKILIPRSGGLTYIGEGAFHACQSLYAVNLPPVLQSLGDGAFCGCAALTEAHLPATVKHMGEMIFEGCERVNIVCEGTAIPRHWPKNWTGCDARIVLTGRMPLFIGSGRTE